MKKCALLAVILLFIPLKSNIFELNPYKIALAVAGAAACYKAYPYISAYLSKNNSTANNPTTLVEACKNRNINIAKALINSRADVNTQDEQGNTPLIYAATAQNTEFLEFLLKHKDIKINKANKDGDTPLHYAAIYAAIHKSDTHLKLLLKHQDINVNSINLKGRKPMYGAIQMHANQSIELLLQHPKITILDEEKNLDSELLQYALSNRATEKITSLYLDLIIHTKHFENQNVLHTLSQHPKFENYIQKILNENEININKQNNEGETPLHIAIKNNNTKTVNLLLSHPQIDIYSQCNAKNTPLVYLVDSKIPKNNLLSTPALLFAQPIRLNSNLSEQAFQKLENYSSSYAAETFNFLTTKIPQEGIKALVNGPFPIQNHIESKYIQKFLNHCYMKLKDNSSTEYEKTFASSFIQAIYEQHLLKLKSYISIKDEHNETLKKEFPLIINAQNYNDLDNNLKEKIEKNYKKYIGFNQ